MASVASDTVTAFSDFKVGRTLGNYMFFELNKSEIKMSEQGSQNVDWNSWVEQIKSKDACWCTFHFAYETKTGGKRSKLILIRWIGTKATPQQKMSYAMWTSTVKQALNGIAFTIQACSLADLDFDEVLSRVSRFERDEVARS